ncbi:MAG TPA: hypothetical protein VG897_14135, partial [Terriglobales bacterium]|nr:hypothetical protein [Terriglobales bacterium]
MLMVYLRTAVCASILLTGLAGWACSCSSPGPAPCGDLKNAGMAFVGTVTHIENPPDEKKGTFQGGTSRYRFTVDEDINGMKANEVDVYSGRGGADCSFHFSLGKTYLVFPYKQNDGRLFATICSETQAIEDAGPLLEELRAQRDGKPFASLYGVLRRTQQPYEATSSADYDQPIPHITIELHGEKNTLSTQTDDNGTYRFYSVPADKYRFVAKLPVNLALGEAILDDPDPGIELPANSCYRQDLEALPTSKIRGRVLGPDGNPLKYADVELFRPDKYSDSERGWWEFQDKEEGLFEFKHVAPGAYILVFHNSNNRDADIPYERTFYPNARDLASATPIVIQDG